MKRPIAIPESGEQGPIDTFTCESCGATHHKTWSDAEAHGEAKANFGEDVEPSDEAVICDDCYKKFMPWAAQQGIVVGGDYAVTDTTEEA